MNVIVLDENRMQMSQGTQQVTSVSSLYAYRGILLSEAKSRSLRKTTPARTMKRSHSLGSFAMLEGAVKKGSTDDR